MKIHTDTDIKRRKLAGILLKKVWRRLKSLRRHNAQLLRLPRLYEHEGVSANSARQFPALLSKATLKIQTIHYNVIQQK